MPEKEKKSEFTVTDRRLFSPEGELRPDVVEAEERREEREQEQREAQKRTNEARSAHANHEDTSPAHDERSAHISAIGAEDPKSGAKPQGEDPEPPTAAEQRASAQAYQESNREMDAEIRKELGKQGQAHRAQEFEMNFEKFIASLYMSALMQLGMAAPQGGEPHVDLIGARQTIDIIGILQEKTKRNLTPKEEGMLQNVLYELRMAYLEVTNLIAQAPSPGKGGDGRKQ